jgi:hypothetical protein
LRANPALRALSDDLGRRIREKCWCSLAAPDPKLQPAFDRHVDPEVVLLHTIGVEKLAYVREQYWFHLEFQLNLLLSVGAIAIALILSSILNAATLQLAVSYIGACVAVAGLAMWGLLAAARKNYARHVAKMASIMAAVLCPPQETCAS